MHDGRPIMVIPLTKLQGRKRVPKAGSLFEVGCPFIHVPEQQTCLYIFQDRFHRVLVLTRFSIGRSHFRQLNPQSKTCADENLFVNSEKIRKEFAGAIAKFVGQFPYPD